MNKRKMLGYLVVVVIFMMMVLTGCSKNMSAEQIAKQFVEDLNDGKAYKMSHRYVESGDHLDLMKDSNGNVHATFISSEGIKSEIYFIDDKYTVYVEDVISNDYTDEELKDYLDEVLKEAPFYVDATIGVFSTEIDSDVVALEDENVYRAVGEYEDGTGYYYSYGMDGLYFDTVDVYDHITIQFDEAIAIKLP